ncbi:MAG: hypothetical protein H8D54_04840 [Candidatus Omnitrophica bacterium]|nr:hypothetical protein [Candidatus Omnitrophota bacterium]
MVSAYIAARSFNPTQELKIKDIVTKRTVREPDELHGKNKKCPLTLITRRIRKDAKGSGMRAALDITRNIGINILNIPKGIMPCSRSAI